MDRINHVKLVTPEPEAVDRFLREVVDMPEGWPVGPRVAGAVAGDHPGARTAAGPDGALTWDDVVAHRGDDRSGGFISGSRDSGQFQILRGARAHVWAVAIGTRHIERAHKRCVERGIPCSEMRVVDWNEKDDVRAFFAEVGGIVFEVMRVEPKA